MKKNVTISLDEDVLKAVRLRAAEAGISFQDFVRKVLGREARTSTDSSLKEFWDLADKIGAKSDGKYLKREELYDREVLRRHEPFLVRERRQVAKKAKRSEKPARRTRKK